MTGMISNTDMHNKHQFLRHLNKNAICNLNRKYKYNDTNLFRIQNYFKDCNQRKQGPLLMNQTNHSSFSKLDG